MTLTEMQDSINAVVADCTTQFVSTNPGRLIQMVDTCETVNMVISALFTEVPYRP